MKKRDKISFSLIAHNEEHNIKRCLESIKWADEIILVDCASTDKTVRIAKKYTKKIYHQKNNPNLNINKSFGISKAKHNWIFYIDPDEEVSLDLKNKILKILQNDSLFNAYRMPRKNFYIFNFLKYGGNYPDYQIRLFKKNHAKFLKKHVHEKLIIKGETGTLKTPLLHYPYNTIKEYIKKLNFYTNFQADFWHVNKKKINIIGLLYIFFIKSYIKFIKKYILKFGFLDGMAGLFAAFSNSLTIIISNFKLFELYQKKNKKNN